MSDQVSYTTPAGATLTLQSAGHVLSAYVNSFGHDPASFRIDFTFSVVKDPESLHSKDPSRPKRPAEPHQPPPGSLFTCQVALPVGIPIKYAKSPGLGFHSKDKAKKRASYELVKTLMAMGEIDDLLRPTPKGVTLHDKRKAARVEKVASRIEKGLSGPLAPSRPDDDRTANQRIKSFRQALESQLPPPPQPMQGIPGISEYDHLVDAHFWKDCGPLSPDLLYPTLFALRFQPPYEKYDAECRVMCLITSRPLPIFSNSATRTVDVSLYGIGREQKKVEAEYLLTKCIKLESLSSSRLEKARTFTQRLVRSHLHKDVTITMQSAPWLLLPLQKEWSMTESTSREGIKVRRRDIAWDEVDLAAQAAYTTFDAKDLEALRQVMDDAMTATPTEFGKRYYVQPLEAAVTTASSRKVRPLPHHPSTTEKALDDGPGNSPSTFMASLVHACKGGGFVFGVASHQQEERRMSFQDTLRHTIPASVARATSNLPAFFTCLNDLMITQEFNERCLGAQLSPNLALLALSCPSAHGTHPQKSYQRLEYLGDTLLKLGATVFCLLEKPDTGVEWENFHTRRQVMGSNKTLHSKAETIGVAPYIRLSKVKPKDWIPGGWQVRGPNHGTTTAPTEIKVTIGHKTMADVVEALVAAAYLSNGSSLDAAVFAMQRLGMLGPQMKSWSDSAHGTEEQTSQSAGYTDQIPVKVLGYEFNNPQLARDALSMDPERGRRSIFQRYKVLGDALGDYFVVEDLYNNYPFAQAGPMTHMRHSRRGDACLAAFCASSGLMDLVTDVPVQVQSQMKGFKTGILRAKSKADARRNPEDRREFWTTVPPQHYLGEIVNALFGAMLVDQGFDVAPVREVYEKQLVPFQEAYGLPATDHPVHPHGVLDVMLRQMGCQRWEIQKNGQASSINPFESIVVMHDRNLGIGYAETQLLATRKACADALKQMETEATKNLCDCPRRKRLKGEKDE